MQHRHGELIDIRPNMCGLPSGVASPLVTDVYYEVPPHVTCLQRADDAITVDAAGLGTKLEED